jgi:hypothetical protein
MAVSYIKITGYPKRKSAMNKWFDCLQMCFKKSQLTLMKIIMIELIISESKFHKLWAN